MSTLFISFDLTYEGLKYAYLLSASCICKLFWSYLWGIEIQKNKKDRLIMKRFDLTYEGLKYLVHAQDA